MSLPAETQKPATTLAVIKGYVESESIKKRFADVLGDKAPQFLASISSLVSSAQNFNGVDPNTIMASALVAATLDLPINPSLGFAYIIPYSGKATFQVGYKGFLQLALRSGQYQTINATEVFDGEVVGLNRLTGELSLDGTKKKSEDVIGYAAYFRLNNGFEKTLYMSIDQINAHAEKFSKSYDNPKALWKKDFHSMAMKTVLKMLLSKYGILSVNMQRAIETDQAVVKEDGEVDYVDSTNEPEPNASDELAAKAKSALEKQKELPPGLVDLKVKSAAHRKSIEEETEKAANREAIVALTKKADDAKNEGEMLEDDYAYILDVLDKKESEILSKKKK